MKGIDKIKILTELIILGIKDLFTSQPCVLATEYKMENGETVGACLCDPVGDCSLKYEGKCWITGRKRPFLTPFKFRKMVAKGKVFNCATHEWEEPKNDGCQKD